MFGKLDNMLSQFDIYEREMLMRNAIVTCAYRPEIDVISALKNAIDQYKQEKENEVNTRGNS